MAEANLTIYELYEWVCRADDELQDIKASFPESLSADRSRLVMSFSCLRVSLELRVRHPSTKRPGGAPPASGPQSFRQSLPY